MQPFGERSALKCKIKGPDDIVEAVRAIVRHNASPPPTLNPLPHVLAEPLARVGLKTFTFNDTVAGPSRGSDIELKACFVLYRRAIWLEFIVYGGGPFSLAFLQAHDDAELGWFGRRNAMDAMGSEHDLPGYTNAPQISEMLPVGELVSTFLAERTKRAHLLDQAVATKMILTTMHRVCMRHTH